MNRIATMPRIESLRRRLAAAQVELALCIEELFQFIESAHDEPSAHRSPKRGHRGERSSPRQKRASVPVVDGTTYTITWGGRTCHMGVGYPFRLMERLSRRPNCLVSYDQLIQDVWRGAPRSDETLRSEVRRVRRHLRAAGMSTLADAIKGRNRHYGLILDPER